MPIDFDNIKLTGDRKYKASDLSALNDSLSYLPVKQRAAVLASILEESQGNSMSVSKTKNYQGLLQWGNDRYKIKDKGKKELSNQLQYLRNTIDNSSDHISWTNGGKGSGYKSYKDTYADFHNQALPLDKVLRAFSYGYVRPYGKEDSFNNRLKVAEQIYSRLSTPEVPVNNIAQPDALRVAKPLIPPVVPEVHNVPFISVSPNAYAEGGMLYSGQDDVPYTPQEEYQDEYQNNVQDTPQEKQRLWDELSLSEKNAFIASAVKHGITNMEDIKRAYNELSQEQVNDTPEETEEDGNKFLKGGYKPSRKIRNYIANKEGASMKTNRSFEAEAKDFWSVMPEDVRSRLTQEQADALYSYSYNVGAINFKHRVVPALQRYFSGNGSVEDVQKHMYATKDSQLRGLAKRRAEERAMFAGSSVPVYSDSPYADSGNTWRSSRLGPVTSINMSKGLGVVNNSSGLLGPVSNERQDNAFMQEAINTLYDDSKPTLMEVPQEEQSSLDRYNAIQDYLSSINPFGYARGGRMYDKGGVTSSNGQYHVEPSEYSRVLGSAANGNPLEVTLPDTTVTAVAPRNYRSYYDPNGFMDFANVVTLGLPNRGSVSQDLGLLRDAYDAFKGNKSWEDVGLSAIMGNKGVFDNPYANLALDFAVPMGIYGADKLKSPKFISELDWSPESWFSKRAGGKYDAGDVKALKSHVPEYLDIEKKAKADGTWLKMADGTTWQGDPRSWVQLQSKKVQEMNPEQFWTGIGQDINPTYNGILWGTYGKGKTPAIKAREYALSDNHLLPMITPKNSTTSTYNANNSWWKDIDKKALGYDDYQGKIKTDDLVRASQRAGDRITKIENVIDPGPNIVPKKSSFYVGGISNNWLIPQNDIILRDGTVRKSLLGNNGNFDWINPNIYKGLLPLAGLYYLDKKE